MCDEPNGGIHSQIRCFDIAAVFERKLNWRSQIYTMILCERFRCKCIEARFGEVIVDYESLPYHALGSNICPQSIVISKSHIMYTYLSCIIEPDGSLLIVCTGH